MAVGNPPPSLPPPPLDFRSNCSLCRPQVQVVAAMDHGDRVDSARSEQQLLDSICKQRWGCLEALFHALLNTLVSPDNTTVGFGVQKLCCKVAIKSAGHTRRSLFFTLREFIPFELSRLCKNIFNRWVHVTAQPDLCSEGISERPPHEAS